MNGRSRLSPWTFRSLFLGAVVAIAACATPVPSPPSRSEAPTPTSLASPFPSAGAAASEAAKAFDLKCGPIEQLACDALAAKIASDLAREYPGKQIVSMALSGPDDGYTVRFDDGTAVVVTVD